jgi:hypothetical protein
VKERVNRGFKNKESGARSQESEERKEYWNAGMLGKEQGAWSMGHRVNVVKTRKLIKARMKNLGRADSSAKMSV